MHVVVVLLFVSACGFEAPRPHPGDPVEVDAGAPPGITPQSMLVQIVTLECQAAFACRSQYPQNANPFTEEWGADLNECVTGDKNYIARDAVAASCATGTIDWDPAAAFLCAASPGIPTSCSVLFSENWSWADTCLAALKGRIADGGSCTNDWECGRTSDCRSGKCMQ